MIFEKAIKHVLEKEGGYVDHPHDPGGATNMGITLATYRRYVNSKATKAELKAMPEHVAKKIYRDQYWQSPGVWKLPNPIAFFVFDGAVNHGPRMAIKFLQRSLGVGADGVIGPVTVEAVSKSDLLVVMIKMTIFRAMFYARLSTFKTFGNGWTKRLIETVEKSYEVTI